MNSELSEMIKKDKSRNFVDQDFYFCMSHVHNMEAKKIKQSMKQDLKKIKQRNPELYNNILACYNTFLYWGKLVPEENIYELIDNRVTMLKEHQDDFIWLYNRLEDYRSKKCLFGIVANWLTFDSELLRGLLDNAYKHYFDLDIINCGNDEVFVDLGAYIGDTIMDYIYSYSEYKKIYCYEINLAVFRRLQSNLKNFHDIELRRKGAARADGYLYISDNEPNETTYKLLNKGKRKISVVAIDNDITEPVTFIKMDIEGGEQEAIWGCQNHIRNTHPKLAISVYHNNEDIWKCAHIIDKISPGYRFYLRYSGGDIYPSEYVLYAVFANQ